DNDAFLTERGFENPSAVASTARKWMEARVRATYSHRARARLDTFLPILIDAAARTDAPDLAFARFAQFFERLPSGVQILSMFVAEPLLVRSLVQLLVLAPRLAPLLASRPGVIDAMLDQDFSGPLTTDASAVAATRAGVVNAGSFEASLNAARRIAHEDFFRIGAHVLLGTAPADEAGKAYAELADALVGALAETAIAEVERRAGAIDAEFVVLGLGKLGGKELSAGSDLDLMTIYRPATDNTVSTGPQELRARTYFARVTQRLIAALSVPTEEGALYEVDMQLRPSGSAGPIAVRCSAFERYYADEAWTWEMMALTRARVVAGSPQLARDVEAMRRAFLARPRDREALVRDVADMRQRMARDKPARGRWDLKLAPGGLVDIEFVAQFLQLATAADAPQVLDVSTPAALAKAREAGALTEADADALIAAAQFQLDLNQLLRVAYEGVFEPERASPQFRARLASAGGAADFEALEAKLAAMQDGARAVFVRLLGAGAP
ncbi:MAG: glutamine-synthetase adenylyltransferase, partial [Caulobacterales bacterium]|nr:glutamine-synthetase adenylyltransferase [Caulobacterales bacterium]